MSRVAPSEDPAGSSSIFGLHFQLCPDIFNKKGATMLGVFNFLVWYPLSINMPDFLGLENFAEWAMYGEC